MRSVAEERGGPGFPPLDWSASTCRVACRLADIITRARLTFDGGGPTTVTLDQRSRVPAGQTVGFGNRTFQRFEITVLATNDRRNLVYPFYVIPEEE